MAGRNERRANTPTLLQMEAAECGAAALGIVLAHYGVYLPLETLRMECGVSRNGSRASNMIRASRRLGMAAGGYKISAEGLKEMAMPCIIHWDFNHFLVLEGFENGKVFLNDPAVGHRTVNWNEFEGSYTGICLKLEPGPNFVKRGKPVHPLLKMINRLREHNKATVFVLAAGLGLVAPGIAFPVMQQIFLDDILAGQHNDWMFSLLLAMGLTALLQGALTGLRAWCLARWQGSLTIGGSGRFIWHILHLPMEFFQQRYAGEVAARVQFHETVAMTLTGQVATAVLDLAVALFYLLLLFQYNVTLTLAGCFFSAINVVVLKFMLDWLKEQQMKLQQDLGKAYGVTIAGIQNIETLKANGNESDFFVKWAGCQSKVLEVTQKAELTQQMFLIAPMLLSGLNTAIIMAVGGFEIMDGLMTAGIFMAFQNLMGKFQEPVNKLLSLVQSVQTMETQTMWLDDVMRCSEDDTLAFSQDTPASIPEKLSGRVEFHEVVFGYSRLEPPLLENLCLTITPGRKVALVGGSGSGKSTVAKLLAGLYKPWSGDITFDGISRNKLPRDVLTHSLAGVDQEIFLFSGSLAENIALFDPTVPRFDIVRAARDAAIHDDISALPGGYDAVVEEGGRNFSGGQRQRIEIARALAGNPSLLILDEATSALDPVTESQVMDNITRRGCACLVIAHRLSTIRDCDEIIVLEKGKVVQRGTHEQMMVSGGPYRQLLESDLNEAASERRGAVS